MHNAASRSPQRVNARASLLRNIAGNWIGVGADAVTGVVLTRIILHAVGDAPFGLWVLVSGLLGYYGLLDLGTRNGVIRYVARHNARGDFESLSSVVSTAVSGYVVIGLAVLVLTVMAAWQLDHLFTFHSAADLAAGRLLILILGTGAAIGFPLSAFGGALEGLQQFVRIGVVQATASVARAIMVVIALRLGYGIVAVGVITVACNVAAGIANAAYVVRRFPEVRIALSGVRRDTFATLAGFGVVTFWVAVSNRLRFESDSLVIGRMIGLEMVAVFAIGSKILSYGTEVVAAMAGVFTPALSHADALGDHDMVTRMTLTGNHLASLLAFPMTVVLFFFGKVLIALWVGARYELAYMVLLIIGVPMAVYMSQFGSTRMLYGVGRHKALAKILFFEGAANLVLSIVLARRFGILGVAWGTAIPLALTAFVILPWVSCQSLGSSLASYWAAAQLPALVTVAPLIALFGAMAMLRRNAGPVEAMAQLMVGAVLYAALVFRRFQKPPAAFAH